MTMTSGATSATAAAAVSQTSKLSNYKLSMLIKAYIYMIFKLSSFQLCVCERVFGRFIPVLYCIYLFILNKKWVRIVE